MEDGGSKRSGAGVLKGLALVLITLSVVTIATVMAINSFGLFRTVDRSGPTLLERIRTLEEFTAAEASFIQDVDSEKDQKYLPSLISGEHVVALVEGSVRATVDFSGLGESSLEVDEEAGEIQISLPQPVLSDAEIDEKSMRILTRERGFFDRAADFFAENPTDDRPLFDAAQQKMNQAAAHSDLLARGRDNTERWLATFLGAAGFETVVVNWG